MLRIEGRRLHVQQIGERRDACLAAGRALVDGLAVCDRLRVGATARVATLPALRLRQDRVDLVRDGIALGAKAYRGKAEEPPENRSEGEHRGECSQQRVVFDQRRHDSVCPIPVRQSP